MYRIRYHEQVLGLQTIVCSSRNGIAWRQETDRGIECRKIGLNKLRGYKILELLSKSNYLFARDAHPHITSANELYINLKTMLAKFLRSTKVKQKQTLPNIKLATDESFLLILTALIDIFYTFAPAYISCKEMYLYQALKKFGIK